MNTDQPMPRAAVEALAEHLIGSGYAQGGAAVALGQDLLAGLARQGFAVVPAACPETTETHLSRVPRRYRCVLGPHDGSEHRCRCGTIWTPIGECLDDLPTGKSHT
ncbi:hypothetical protein Ssi03_76320 [Sphaerisporangium siamense]|uniref:Uncharacterized protein n=1 Tax=Sphaerisporangium siamense TaxID=795645 RepID=A0A7W7D314_9ACTN|nr:hypothetical protein [Sphaerisporangium siamense]MBB4699313.1 hypothetical protein [Sphaerisporangium siamense]GII89642.1 hypothetical protein Ssi03_76320 [Sphaerisporangium siamense]